MKHALRQLCNSPGFTVVAIITLALGIGVNTAMFSVVRTFLLKPAPYPEADRLVRVFRTSPQSKTLQHAAPDLDDVRAQSHALESVTGFVRWSFSLSQPGQPAENLDGVVASADLFATLGVQPALGRAFTAAEQQVGRDNVVVITDAMWRSRFAADPAIIGRTIRIDGTNQTVIGVMPPSFAYPLFWNHLEVIRPLVFAVDWQHQRGNFWLQAAIARLKPEVTIAHAQTELDTIASRLAQQYPDTNAGSGFRLVPLHETAVDETGRNVSWLTLGLAGFVLLIACANLANLQLARSAARARDYAVRAALGASRGQIMRQVIIESLLLALAGGGLGVLLAIWVNDFLSRRLDLTNGSTVSIPLDWSVLAFALLASVLAGILSGVVPAWFAARTDVNSVLKSQARGATGDRSRHRFRHSLIVAEIAFALVLLAGAGFFIRGLQRFADRDPGWRSSNLLTGEILLPFVLPSDRYANDGVRREFYDRVLQRLATLPGVEHAALATSLPIRGFNNTYSFSVEGRPDPAPGHEPVTYRVFVTADFFKTIGLQLIEGRFFPENTRSDGPRVAIINESMARQLWPNESAVGRRIGSVDAKNRDWLEIIGVVRDVGFIGNIAVPDTRYQVYGPLVQNPWGSIQVVLRGRNPAALAEPLRHAVAEIDPDLPVNSVNTAMGAVDTAQRNIHTANELLAGFALLGLVLAAVGLYGVIATLVVQRTHEFGIRLALGAQTRDVLCLVLGKSVGLTVVGSTIGLLGAAGLLALLTKLIPGLPGFDPTMLAGTVVVLLAVSLLACWLPARRATKVDPITALRAE